MIPMKRVVSARRDVTRAELVELLRGSNFSHVPLTEGGKVVGVLDIYEFLIEPGSSDPAATPAAPAEKMRLPFFLSYAMTVTDTLYHMQREKQTMAIIKDDPGNHVGIVTIKDLVEEIVGELAEY
jgi:CBS domain containing-hemolysin-like protein